VIVMHACQCEKPAYAGMRRLGRFGGFGRSFREEAIAPPSEETLEGESQSFEVTAPGGLMGENLKSVVKTAVVFWAVTRMLDHVFLKKGS
jgi:hypothetical protein